MGGRLERRLGWFFGKKRMRSENWLGVEGLEIGELDVNVSKALPEA